jgi:V/A-type H+-transporting ATPase subunit C
MTDFDYGNARLRAMKSRLLSRHVLEALAESGSLTTFIAGLSKTVYQKAVETALARASGMQCVDEALRSDLISTIGNVRNFYQDDAAVMVNLLLRKYDIHNLKSILRGLSKNAPASEILATLLPVGELDMSLLRQMAQSGTPREAMDTLISIGSAFRSPLLAVRSRKPGAEISEWELALEKWYYEESTKILKEIRTDTSLLIRALALDADIENVMTILRFAQIPRETALPGEHISPEEIERLFVRAGRIELKVLQLASRADSVLDVVEAFSETYLADPLYDALEVYARSRRLSDIERHLRRFRLRWLAGQIARDPLGFGVVLGYVALKVNEIGNLRWIAQGVHLGMKSDAIRSELELI